MQATRASWDTEELHDEAWREATLAKPRPCGMLDPTRYAPSAKVKPVSGMLRRVLAVLALHILLPIIWPL